MKTKRILEIKTKVHENGTGAVAECFTNYEVGTAPATTAVAKAVAFLNIFCERHRLGFHLEFHDDKTSAIMDAKIVEEG